MDGNKKKISGRRKKIEFSNWRKANALASRLGPGLKNLTKHEVRLKPTTTFFRQLKL
jgi:hypothetical protein